MKAKPKLYLKEPLQRWRKPFYKLSKSVHFDRFIFVAIIINTINLALYWYRQPKLLDQITNIINIVFTVIFLLESIIKIIGYGSRYFKDGWNIFDFIVMVTSFIGIIISYTYNFSGAAATTAIRAIRIARIFKLFRK